MLDDRRVLPVLHPGGRRRLAVPGHVERDHAVARQHFGVVHHSAPLPRVGPRGVQAQQRDALPGLLHIDAVRHALDGQPQITAGDGLENGIGHGAVLVGRAGAEDYGAGLGAMVTRRNIADALTLDYDRPMLKVVMTENFEKWLDGLRDPATRRRLVLRLRKASLGNLGDVKAVGQGVYEMREFFGPGWRMYFARRGNTLILMLGGGSKATQDRDIATAITLAGTIEE